MNVKKYLKLLRKPDDFTDKTISEEYPADWNSDEIFEKSFENFILKKESEENSGEYEILKVTEERKTEKYSGMFHVLIAAAACAAVIIILGKTSYEHIPDEITPLVSVTETAVITETKPAVTGTYETAAGITRSTENVPVTEYVTVISEVPAVTEENENNQAIFSTDAAYNYTEGGQVNSETVNSEDELPEITESVITDAEVPEITEITEVTENKEESRRMLTLEELFEITEKDGGPDWSDFDEFISEDTESEIYIKKYEIEGGIYYLIIGGRPDEKPDYIRLYSEFSDSIYIDTDSEDFADLKKMYTIFGF